jgi:hypothetical protein
MLENESTTKRSFELDAHRVRAVNDATGQSHMKLLF